jgi:hypothetical protein
VIRGPARGAALSHGFGSILVIPLSVDARVFGTLAIYASESAAFGPKERESLSELADDLAFGLTTLSWARRSILNVARGGPFSSDRAVAECARDIWGIRPA